MENQKKMARNRNSEKITPEKKAREKTATNYHVRDKMMEYIPELDRIFLSHSVMQTIQEKDKYTSHPAFSPSRPPSLPDIKDY